MSSNRPTTQDLTRLVLAVLFIGLLTVASLWILWPFLGAAIWATMIVVATWPLMIGVQKRLRGKRWLAVTVMTFAILLIFIVPLSLAIVTIIDHRDDITGRLSHVASANLPPPPAWVDQIPVVGPRVADRWRELAATGPEELAEAT